LSKLLFYLIKPYVPRRLQITLRRRAALLKRRKVGCFWPIDPKAGKSPADWPGWPDGKQFALVLTHDVDTQKGHNRCHELLDLEERLGFRSSFNFVPERYKVSAQLLIDVKKRGFEVGVHGLKHDGKLYLSKKNFNERASKINGYLKKWGAVGFRSPAMHHKLEWIHALDIQYDLSTFDTDPFEPQPDGIGTIFPFWINNNSDGGYVELPYTLPQDFTLFVLLKETSINIWREKLDWIAKNNGMALLNTHPDYMNFDGSKLLLEEYPFEYYKDFLLYVENKYRGRYWCALPKDVASLRGEKVEAKK
jgi:peptidoglycan/xylan/chitin deacetylase (PgdA/CDA1 family)